MLRDRKFTVAMIDQQLAAHRLLGQDKEIPLKSHLHTKTEKLDALLAAVARYQQRGAELAETGADDLGGENGLESAPYALTAELDSDNE